MLHPHVSRTKKLMNFKDEVVKKFCANLILLARVEGKKKGDDVRLVVI